MKNFLKVLSVIAVALLSIFATPDVWQLWGENITSPLTLPCYMAAGIGFFGVIALYGILRIEITYGLLILFGVVLGAMYAFGFAKTFDFFDAGVCIGVAVYWLAEQFDRRTHYVESATE